MDDSVSQARILLLTTPFPSQAAPGFGLPVQQRARALCELGYHVRVVAPVPYFPAIRRLQRWYFWSQFPREEIVEGMTVYHPRYALPPKIGGYFHPQCMYPFVRRFVDKMQRDEDFDIIDSHAFYPWGVVGVMLGRRYNKPVVVTGRGEGILRFVDYPLKRRQIRWALGHADQFVALSDEIAESMRRHGAAAEKINTIPNGVDTHTFRRISQSECRDRLGLPRDAEIVLSVGDRLELKGFHHLVDAMPTVLEHRPRAYLVIVGGPGRYGRDFTAEIVRRVESNGLENRVLLAGAIPHGELPLWYNAADLFALLSSREGSSNVVLESLACGTPVVGTAVGGMAAEIVSGSNGFLLEHRNPGAAAEQVIRGLEHPWDRCRIADDMQSRNWSATARSVHAVFSRLVYSTKVD